MSIERRRLLLASLAVFAAGVARADTTDLVVACDPAIVAAAYKACVGLRVLEIPMRCRRRAESPRSPDRCKAR
jgi:hypothetical protein